MPSKIEEYRDQVYQTYLKKKEEGRLPLNLEDPKPANLRDECLIILSQRHSSIDEKILSDFFGIPKAGRDYAFCIYQYDLKLLKPLQNFLKGKTKQPETKNINLLAWLIDFEDRPFRFDDNAPSIEQKKEYEEEPVSTDTAKENKELVNTKAEASFPSDKVQKIKKDASIIEVEGIMGGNDDLSKKRLKLNYIIILIAVIFIGFSVAALGGWINIFHKEECMYWKENHFESIACNQDSLNINAIALNPERLNHFQKITRIDTLKENCIGKIWYSKIDNELEFFTGSGMHPVHIEKGLKLVTLYIYDTYIREDASKIPGLEK